jgi:hypothetical protein
MGKFSLERLNEKVHSHILAWTSGLLFLSFLIICITDLNHPPGLRMLRVCVCVPAILIAVAEWRIPWSGVAVYCAIWPFYSLIKYSLYEYGSTLFEHMPNIVHWPCAGALTLAIVIRQFRGNIVYKMPPVGVKYGRITSLLPLALYSFACVVILSSAFNTIAMNNAPSTWGIQNVNFRNLLFESDPLSITHPIRSGITILINIVFTIALIRAVLFESSRAESNSVMWLFLVSMVVVGLIAIYQRIGGWHFRFDEGPPSSTFTNRNTSAPMMVVAAVLMFKFVTSKRMHAFAGIISLLLLVSALISGSRNAIFMTGVLPLFFLMYKMSIKAIIISSSALLAFVTLVVFVVPLPVGITQTHSESLSRSISLIRDLRNGDLTEASSNRNHLWHTAFRIWMQYPLLGSGPGTYYVHAVKDECTRSEWLVTQQVPSISAHSTPINLLAETGPIGATSWIFIFIIYPFWLIQRARSFSPIALGLLVLGVSNFFDTLWYVNGGMTFAAILVALGFQEVAIEKQLETTSEAD